VPAPSGYTEEGTLSWYGVPFHGRHASNGEIYDMYKLTAAHRTLPFETMVRVTNLNNGKTTVVRITDRGPFVDNRIIDLSLAAAREVDSVGPGVVPARVEVLGGVDPTAGFFTCRSVLSANAPTPSVSASASAPPTRPSSFSNMILPTACFIACASAGFPAKTPRTSLAGNFTTSKVLLRLLRVSTKAHPQREPMSVDVCSAKSGRRDSIEDRLRRS